MELENIHSEQNVMCCHVPRKWKQCIRNGKVSKWSPQRLSYERNRVRAMDKDRARVPKSFKWLKVESGTECNYCIKYYKCKPNANSQSVVRGRAIWLTFCRVFSLVHPFGSLIYFFYVSPKSRHKFSFVFFHLMQRIISPVIQIWITF